METVCTFSSQDAIHSCMLERVCTYIHTCLHTGTSASFSVYALSKDSDLRSGCQACDLCGAQTDRKEVRPVG